jgi:hypothetical protein
MSAWCSMVAALNVERPRRHCTGGDFVANVDRLRRLSGALQAGNADAQWLGDALMGWLHHGGDLVEVLGVKSRAGSRLTAQAIVLRDMRDAALLRLSAAAGGDAKALAILCGRPCPERILDLFQKAVALGAPKSRAAFTRARQRASRAHA